MSRNVVTNASPPGAGRTLDAYLQLTDGASLSTAARSSQNVGRQQTLAGGSYFSNIGGGGTRVFQNNRFANNYVPATGDGTILVPGVDHYITAPSFAEDSQEVGAIRVVCSFKVTGLPAVFPPASGPASDFGLVFYGNTDLAGLSNVMSAAPSGTQNAGFGFACNTAGNPVFVLRKTQAGGANPPDEVTVLDAVNSLATDYMTFDVRFAGATSTSPATLNVVLNGLSVLTRSWGGGTLPTVASLGAVYKGAFRTIFGTASGSGITSLQLSFWRVIKGPTFSSLF